MKGKFPLSQFKSLNTPFYFYDMQLLQQTLDVVKQEIADCSQFKVHYALKANVNADILQLIKDNELGADCVSGGEIREAIKAGFKPENIVFAGVGKADWEIELGLDLDIFCFNVESIQELEIINELALQRSKTARICIRVNPDIKAKTHANIATGASENKFGISYQELDRVLENLADLKAIEFIGLHFHIGSQILDMSDFVALCNRINELVDTLEAQGIRIMHLNVGGGLGINYDHPDRCAMPDFKEYFKVYDTHLRLRSYQTLHFELGRSIVGQCGTLISRVLYVKEGENKKFAILDAGMNDLVRPALYQAYHKVENLSSNDKLETYDVVGPVCESSDVFGKAIDLNKVSRGDYIAIRSAGAYGEVMASQYNCRSLPSAYTSEDFF